MSHKNEQISVKESEVFFWGADKTLLAYFKREPYSTNVVLKIKIYLVRDRLL